MDSEDKSIQFNQSFQVRWSDLDGNAHMGNRSYLDYASDTRVLFFSEHGFALSRFSTEKFGPVIIRDELIYRKELRLMESFSVDFKAVGLSENGTRFRVRNTFLNASNVISAIVTSEGVWFDLETRRPRIPPSDLDKLMRNLLRSEDYAEILPASSRP